MARRVSEHWTLSRECMVLRGPLVEINRVARDLELPEQEVICVSPTRAVLGLWGEPLVKYAALVDRLSLTREEPT